MFSRRQFLNLSIMTLAVASTCASSWGQETSLDKSTPLVKAARKQIGITTLYDGGYTKIPFPNGDVPRERGVCTDVIIRAYRDALNYDLQKNVNNDMKNNFSSYPKIWGLTRPDANIDHRRVPNLQTFFRRKNAELPKNTPFDKLQPGDLITMMLPKNLPHIVIVSDKKTANGRPYVIHNVGRGTQEEDFLDQYPITGIYRFKPQA